jgi:hypothetical protein
MTSEGEKRRRLLRSPSEVVECRLRALVPGEDWHPLSVGSDTLARWFRLLESAPLTKKSGSLFRDRLEWLHIRFQDGVSIDVLVQLWDASITTMTIAMVTTS